MKSLKNICKKGHFPLRYALKIPTRELMFSIVATWRPANWRFGWRFIFSGEDYRQVVKICLQEFIILRILEHNVI